MTNVKITPTDNGPYQVDGPVTELTPEAAIAVVESFMDEVWAACNPSAVDRFVTVGRRSDASTQVQNPISGLSGRCRTSGHQAIRAAAEVP